MARAPKAASQRHWRREREREFEPNSSIITITLIIEKDSYGEEPSSMSMRKAKN